MEFWRGRSYRARVFSFSAAPFGLPELDAYLFGHTLHLGSSGPDFFIGCELKYLH